MKDSPLILPEELEPFRSQFEASVKSFIRITAAESTETALWDSKFGGLPYLPKGFDYPKDENSKYLFMLAQINCEELPNLQGFPQKGILQFYVADDDMYGLSFENPTQQANFRIIYFQEIEKENCQTDFSFLQDFDDVPVTKTYALSYKIEEEPVAPEDIAFEHYFEEPAYEFFEQFPEKVEETYKEKYAGNSHKMGGYAYFTQEDPRLSDPELEPYQLLLQIDSDTEGITWGDMGIGNFFIKPEDLENFNFSEVLYNWDCP